MAGETLRRCNAAVQENGGAVRGRVVQAHLRWVETYGNTADVDAVLLELRRSGGSLRFTDDDWIPFRVLLGIDRTIASRFSSSGSADDVMEDVGRYVGRSLFPAPLREWTNDDRHAFLCELASAEHDLVDFAQPAYEAAAQTKGVIRRASSRVHDRLHCAALTGFYEQALLLRGALRPTVSEEICQSLGWPACKFLLRWR